MVDIACGILYLEVIELMKFSSMWPLHLTTLYVIASADAGANCDSQPWESSVLPTQPQLLMFTFLDCSIKALSAARKAALEEARLFYQFEQDSEEDEAWLLEKIRLMKSTDVGRDLLQCTSLIKKHEVSRSYHSEFAEA